MQPITHANYCCQPSPIILIEGFNGIATAGASSSSSAGDLNKYRLPRFYTKPYLKCLTWDLHSCPVSGRNSFTGPGGSNYVEIRQPVFGTFKTIWSRMFLSSGSTVLSAERRRSLCVKPSWRCRGRAIYAICVHSASQTDAPNIDIMGNYHVFLMSATLVVILSLLPSLFAPAEAKFSFSDLSSEVSSSQGLHAFRRLAETTPFGRHPQPNGHHPAGIGHHVSALILPDASTSLLGHPSSKSPFRSSLHAA